MQLGDGLRNLGRLEHLAAQDSPLHRLDPRLKVAVTLAFLVLLASFPRTALTNLLPLAAFPVLTAALAGIPSGVVLRQVLWTLPFMVALAFSSPLLDRTPAGVVAGIPLTQGWLTALSLLLRGALSVAAVTVLAATTGMGRLGQGLVGLGAPVVLVDLLAMLHRYTFVLAEEALRMRQARDQRANGRAFHLREAGTFLGHLLLRAWDRARRVEAAMVARAFDGARAHPRLGLPPFGALLGAVAWIVFFVLARCIDLPLWLGKALT